MPVLKSAEMARLFHFAEQKNDSHAAFPRVSDCPVEMPQDRLRTSLTITFRQYPQGVARSHLAYHQQDLPRDGRCEFLLLHVTND